MNTRPLSLPAPSDLSKEFATAYFDASQAGADMRIVANVLETLRTQLAQATDTYKVWAAFDEQVGSADLDRFMPALTKLAEAFQATLISMHVAQLRAAFLEREQGWMQWLNTYARSFDAAGWRGFYGAEIARKALSYSPHSDWSVEKIRKAAEAVSYERWPETYDWFLFLADCDLPAEYRARFFAIVAEIQIFHFLQPTKARAFLDKAKELSPELVHVRYAWGEYWVALGDWSAARESFQQIIKVDHKRHEGYVGLGICEENTGQLDAAEGWYYQAILNAAGNSNGYQWLLLLLLRPDWPKQRVEQAGDDNLSQSLVRRWKALTERAAVVSVSLGVSYKNRKELDRARTYLNEAVQADPSYASAYVWLGYTELDEAGTADSPHYAAARKYFDTAIQWTPTALDGPWGISALYMQQQDWTAAEEWTNRCLQFHREWESVVLTRRAEIRRRQDRLNDAEADVKSSLNLESVNASALDIMFSLVNDYRMKDQKVEARRLLEEWFERNNGKRADLYHNLLGNWSYEEGDYSMAVEFYRRAIQFSEADPVLHLNLANALQRRHQPGQRCNELREVIRELTRLNELDPREDVGARIAALQAELEFLQVFGESAAALDPVVVPIRVEIDAALVGEILTDFNLAPETTAAVNELRSGLEQKFGITLPGVTFNEMQPVGSGKYRITLNESTSYEGPAKPGSVRADVLAHLQEVVQGHLAEFLGHDNVVRMLNENKASAADALTKNIWQLTRFVGLLRRTLRLRQSITPLITIAEQYLATPEGIAIMETIRFKSSGDPSPGGRAFPQLVVKIGNPNPTFLKELQTNSAELQKGFFDELGVAVPPIVYEYATDLPENIAKLLLNGEEVSVVLNPSAEIIWASLRSEAAHLMVPELTRYYLTKLQDRFTFLIRAVQQRTEVTQITNLLKQRLSEHQSVKNLPGILENHLEEIQASKATPESVKGADVSTGAVSRSN